MAKVAVFIHGMWGTPDVWRNWRPFLEARGWQTIAPVLRHHDAPPLAPPAGLGTTSLGDYVADLANTIEGLAEKPVVIGHSMGGLLALLLCARGLARAGVLLTPAPDAGVIAIRPSNLWAFARIQLKWGWWRKPHRATLAEALSHTFNTTDPREGAELHSTFVHDSGRALFELALPWLDGNKTTTIDPRLVTVPLLLVANWRTDWQRGPSVPSMLSGRPIASALISCFFVSSASAARSTASLPRFSVVSGVASMRKASDVAMPIVLVPTSSAINRPAGTSVFNSAKSTTAIA